MLDTTTDQSSTLQLQTSSEDPTIPAHEETEA